MIEDYIALITSQHATKPKFIAWLTGALKIIDDIQTLLTNMYSYFDIDTAIGVQLDTLGVLLNIPRLLPFQPSDNISAVMDDITYRIVLKARIAESQFDGKVQSLYNLFQTVLGNTGLLFSISDNQNMTVSIIVFGVTTSIISDLITHEMIVPRPGGVSLTINVTANKVFAWDTENELFGGWDEGYWLPEGVK